MKKIYIKLIDIAHRVIKWEKKEAIHTNGVDNLYPDRVERFINNSVTAKMSSDIMTQYIVGAGFLGVLDVIVHKASNLLLFDFLFDLAKSLVDHKGFYVHVKYNVNLNIREMKVLPFKSCRVGFKDDNDYNGKIIFKRDWSSKSDSEPMIVDVFNTDKSVIREQIKEAGSFEKYKGQIYYFNSERKTHYPTARIDSVMNDCDSEAQSSVYKNRLLRRGFFGKTIFMTRPLIDSTINEFIEDEKGKPYRNPEYTEAETEATEFRDRIQEFLGAENADGAMHIEADFDGEKMDEWFAVKTIESKINPSLFLGVEKSLRENILIAYDNLPAGLVKSDESMFSKSGTVIEKMEKQYWKNTNSTRTLFLRQANFLLKHFEGIEPKLTVKSLVEDGDIIE